MSLILVSDGSVLLCTLHVSAEIWLRAFHCCPYISDRNSELRSPFLHISKNLWANKCAWECIFRSSCISVVNIPLSRCWCSQAAKPPDLNPETEESIPSRSSPEGPDPPVLTEVSKQEEQQPLDLEGVKRKMDQGSYTSVVCQSCHVPLYYWALWIALSPMVFITEQLKPFL